MKDFLRLGAPSTMLVREGHFRLNAILSLPLRLSFLLSMANPRRSISPFASEQSTVVNLPVPLFNAQHPSSPLLFFRRPHAFPVLLFCLLLLTWCSLKFHHHYHRYSSYDSFAHQERNEQRESSFGAPDVIANLRKFDISSLPLGIADDRGWVINPVSAARRLGLVGVESCKSVHVGQIRPGAVRGNHRHHTCNETFIIWGAATKFRLENSHSIERGYAEVTIAADEAAVAVSPGGLAHALVNIDRARSTYFLGCQDSILNYKNDTDFKVWKDLTVV